MRENYKRAFEVIQSDKSLLSDGCKSLIERDLFEKLKEYFEMDELPQLEVACVKGVYRVNLTFTAERIKKFNILR